MKTQIFKMMTEIIAIILLAFSLIGKGKFWFIRFKFSSVFNRLMSFLSVSTIDCFKCVSMNGGNPECDDPFHNNHSATILESPCELCLGCAKC